MYEVHGLWLAATSEGHRIGTRRGQYGARVHRGELCSALAVSTSHHKLLLVFNIPARLLWALLAPSEPRNALDGVVMLGLTGLWSVETPASESSSRRPITVALPSASRWVPREAIEVRIGVCTGGDHSEEVRGMLSGSYKAPEWR